MKSSRFMPYYNLHVIEFSKGWTSGLKDAADVEIVVTGGVDVVVAVGEGVVVAAGVGVVVVADVGVVGTSEIASQQYDTESLLQLEPSSFTSSHNNPKFCGTFWRVQFKRKWIRNRFTSVCIFGTLAKIDRCKEFRCKDFPTRFCWLRTAVQTSVCKSGVKKFNSKLAEPVLVGR